jgi:hypothetical protein
MWPLQIRLTCLHLAGLACISVATKTLEIRKPDALVAALIGEEYSEGELQRMEKAVLGKIGKEMPVTPFEVVDAVLRATASSMPRGVRERTLQCHVVAVASVHHYELRSFLPSAVGLAVVSAVLDAECGACADSVVALLCDALSVSAAELAACRRVLQRCLSAPPHR